MPTELIDQGAKILDLLLVSWIMRSHIICFHLISPYLDHSGISLVVLRETGADSSQLKDILTLSSLCHLNIIQVTWSA